MFVADNTSKNPIKQCAFGDVVDAESSEAEEENDDHDDELIPAVFVPAPSGNWFELGNIIFLECFKMLIAFLLTKFLFQYKRRFWSNIIKVHKKLIVP